MDETGMTGYWPQGQGLVSKQMNKIIMWRRIINNVVLPSGSRISIIWIIIISESMVTEKRQDKQD